MPVSGISARESTKTFAWDDDLVSDSMYYIHSRAPLEPLLVTDVVERTNLSHSGFKKRFIRTVGHSPKSEIKRVRKEHLKMLLRTTTLTIHTLAERMRFSSTEELSRFFLREVGTTPSNYRKNPVG